MVRQPAHRVEYVANEDTCRGREGGGKRGRELGGKMSKWRVGGGKVKFCMYCLLILLRRVFINGHCVWDKPGSL